MQVRYVHGNEPQFVHLLHILITAIGSVIEIEPKTEFTAECMLFATENLCFRGLLDGPAAEFAGFGVGHNTLLTFSIKLVYETSYTIIMTIIGPLSSTFFNLLLHSCKMGSIQAWIKMNIRE